MRPNVGRLLLSIHSVARSGRENGGRKALHERFRARLGLYCLSLHLVDLDKLLLDPRVPEVERHLLLLAFDVELAGGDREDEVEYLRCKLNR